MGKKAVKKVAKKVKKAEKKVVAKKVVVKKVASKGTAGQNIGIGEFVRKGLKDGTFKDKTNKEIAEKAVKKLGGTTPLLGVARYVARVRAAA